MLSDQEREERDRVLAYEVARDRRLGETARTVFMLIAAIDTGLTVEALAKRTSKPVEAIERGLAELRDAGYVAADAESYRVNHAG